MVDTGLSPRLLLKTGDQFRVVTKDFLDGHFPIELRITSAPYSPHSTLAQQIDDLESAEMSRSGVSATTVNTALWGALAALLPRHHRTTGIHFLRYDRSTGVQLLVGNRWFLRPRIVRIQNALHDYDTEARRLGG